ncbi:MAG: hypothetical protein Q8N54_10830 [Sulfurimicrobium sp.]|jgi:Flp pilus assembly protein TadD|nr:hypothetical protein [Sulfurimicrobium sp.]MDO9190862.1 hypothetical protein [Sulfurimicrobium sp.]MDP1703121.1 hypothetical protein [Sulfurimicrobium sp.]MDP2197162.1 hypothetical protein [Sulfurimicrobium sp.]MDP2963241.1 hypothetical protein [Sulfurimicrobium sp.]
MGAWEALLLDSSNGLALWGLGVIHAQREEFEESRKSFVKAEPFFPAYLNAQRDVIGGLAS